MENFQRKVLPVSELMLDLEKPRLSQSAWSQLDVKFVDALVESRGIENGG